MSRRKIVFSDEQIEAILKLRYEACLPLKAIAERWGVNVGVIRRLLQNVPGKPYEPWVGPAGRPPKWGRIK